MSRNNILAAQTYNLEKKTILTLNGGREEEGVETHKPSPLDTPVVPLATPMNTAFILR